MDKSIGSTVPLRRGSANVPRVSLIATVAAIGGFLFGFDTAVINGAVTAVGSYYHTTPLVLGFIVSSALLGSALGAVIGGRLADRFGRVPTMLVAAGMFTIQSIGVGFAFTVVDFSVWRFVGGVAVGIASVIAPAYIAEISPARLRGRLGSLQQLAIVTGIFVALLADAAIGIAAGGAEKPWLLGLPAWRWMFLTEVIPAVIYGIGALRIPESPRYLVTIGREDDARSILADIVGPSEVDAKVAEIRQTITRERRSRLADLLGGPLGLLPLVWVGILLSVFQQFVGINVIFYYSTSLWSSVGFTENQSLIITTITSVTNIVGTFIAIAAIDRVGRKPLLMLGAAGMVVTLGVMAYLFGTAPRDAAGNPVLHGLPGTVALIAANVYVLFFAFSWGPVVWVLLGEMFPNKIRAAGLGVAAALQWIANFVVSTTFPTLAHISLGLAYGIYTTCALLAFLFVLALVRETKGKELEAMTS
jgi:MFS transporter, SP family, sugar:H+ symporter